VNKLDAFSIAEEFASDMKNLSSSEFPALSLRPGFSLLGSAIGTRCLGLGIWKDSELHAVFNDGTWRKWTGAAWSSPLVSGLDTSAEWSFCNFKGNLTDFNLIGCNGVNTAKRYDGATVQDLTGAPAGINFIDEHDNRLYGVVNGTEVWFSELNVPTNWSTVAGNDSDPGSIKKEINTGKKIVGLKAGTGHITVAFPTSTHELYGTSPSDFRFIEVAPDIGMLNNKVGTNYNGTLYFASDRSAFTYGGSRPDNSFFERVQAYIDGMNQTAKSSSCAGSDGIRWYLALPMGATATAPDTILEYDQQKGTFSVWEDLQPLFFASMQNTLYMADAQGRVLKMGGTTDNGTAISWRWVSKVFSAASMAQVLRWFRAWVSAIVPAGSTCNVYISTVESGDTDWQLAGTVPTGTNLQSTPIYLDTSMTTNSRFIRVKFEGSGPMELYEFSRDQDSLPIR